VVQFVIWIRIKWAGHVWRGDGSMLKRVLADKTSGKRPRGRPRKRWKESVKELLEKLGVDWK